MAEGEERRFTRTNRGARMALLIGEAQDAAAGGMCPGREVCRAGHKSADRLLRSVERWRQSASALNRLPARSLERHASFCAER